jgi:hypothetical protein
MLTLLDEHGVALLFLAPLTYGLSYAASVFIEQTTDAMMWKAFTLEHLCNPAPST